MSFRKSHVSTDAEGSMLEEVIFCLMVSSKQIEEPTFSLSVLYSNGKI